MENTQLKEEIRTLIKEIEEEFPGVLIRGQPNFMKGLHHIHNDDVSTIPNDNIDSFVKISKNYLPLLNNSISMNRQFKFLLEEITSKTEQIQEKLNSNTIFPTDYKNKILETSERIKFSINQMKEAYNSEQDTEVIRIQEELLPILSGWRTELAKCDEALDTFRLLDEKVGFVENKIEGLKELLAKESQPENVKAQIQAVIAKIHEIMAQKDIRKRLFLEESDDEQ